MINSFYYFSDIGFEMLVRTYISKSIVGPIAGKLAQCSEEDALIEMNKMVASGILQADGMEKSFHVSESCKEILDGIEQAQRVIRVISTANGIRSSFFYVSDKCSVVENSTFRAGQTRIGLGNYEYYSGICSESMNGLGNYDMLGSKFIFSQSDENSRNNPSISLPQFKGISVTDKLEDIIYLPDLYLIIDLYKPDNPEAERRVVLFGNDGVFGIVYAKKNNSQTEEATTEQVIACVNSFWREKNDSSRYLCSDY